MPRFLLSALISLAYTLIFVYGGSIAEPIAARHKWYPKQWRPQPYCGTPSQPLQDTPELLKACREQCASTGQQLQLQLKEGAKTLEFPVPSPVNNCPATGLRYGTSRWREFVVVCRAHPHSQAKVFWDSRSGKVLDSWPSSSNQEEEAKLQDYWCHAWTANYNGDYAQTVEICNQMRALHKDDLDYLLAQAELALGQAQKSLEVCDVGITAAKKAESDSSDFETIRYNCLLELGKAKQVLAENPGPVAKCMAQLELDKTSDASKTLETVQDDPLFSAYALLSLKRYAQARKQAEQVLVDKGWQSDYAGNAIVVGVLSDWLGGASEEQARSFLQKGLTEAPKSWPYPLLRYLNRELCEDELLEAAGSNISHNVEARFTVGLTLLASKRDQSHGRALLREAAAHGQFFEGMAAHCLLAK